MPMMPETGSRDRSIVTRDRAPDLHRASEDRQGNMVISHLQQKQVNNCKKINKENK